MMRKTAMVVAVAGLLSVRGAAADAAGNKVLGEMDAAANKASTFYAEYEIANNEPGKAEKRFAVKQSIKGEKMLLEFTAPADMKGVKVLVLSPGEMYAYLPAFGKVRRIASGTSEPGFMGLAFTVGDLSPRRLATQYTGGTPGETDKGITLTLSPKPGQTPVYSKIEATLNKDTRLPSELKLTGASIDKTETRAGYTCEDGVCTAGVIKMVNHKTSLSSAMTRKKYKVNESISDDLFAKRNLEK